VQTDETQANVDVASIKEVLDPSDEKKLQSLQSAYQEAFHKSDVQLAKARERYRGFRKLLFHGWLILKHFAGL
jgi:hypothetical protein